MQQQRKLKQQFLRQNILDRNYDPQQFIVFLNIRLNIDSDIDRCDLQSLKNIVKEFLSQKENNIIQNVGSRLSSQNLINSKIDQKLTTIIFKQYNPPIVQDQFQTQVKCVKLNNKYTQEQMLKIQCEVKNPERKYSGGLMGIGATSFLQFQVETFGLGWSVGRRYSDFIWLRNTLKKLYPSLIIPPIPNKKASKRLPRQIEKRMRILSLFLNDLLGLPEIFNCRYVQGFLSQKDNSKFEQLKKQGESKPIFQSINSTETLSGTIKINLSNHNKDYVKNLKQFVQKSEVLYKEVTRASKRLQSLKIDEVNQLYQMGNKFAELYETGREFQNKSKSTGISKLTEIYIKLNNMMIEWGNNMKNEIQLLQINCNTFFKYSRQSYIGFHQLFQKLTQQENLFLQNKFKLDARKEKIFLFHDPNKWEISKKEINFIPKSSIHQRTEAFKIMLPKESLENQKNKMNYSYYLTRLFDKSQEYFNKQAQKFNENFKQFSIKSKVNNQQLGQNWSEMCLIYSEGESRVKKLKQMQKISQYQQSQVAYDD